MIPSQILIICCREFCEKPNVVKKYSEKSSIILIPSISSLEYWLIREGLQSNQKQKERDIDRIRHTKDTKIRVKGRIAGRQSCMNKRIQREKEE
jgi:hypothetical protein